MGQPAKRSPNWRPSESEAILHQSAADVVSALDPHSIEIAEAVVSFTEKVEIVEVIT